MKIKTEKIRKGYWRADFIELSGSPSVGEGRTKAEAIACLFCRHKEIIDNMYKSSPILVIDDIIWESGSDIKR